MPIYEYQCQSCSHLLDTLQKVSDAPLTNCPNCHQETLQRLVSAAGFQLKGTGWYATDFKDKGKPEKKTTSSDSDTAKTKENNNSSSNSTTGDNT